ncbi:hypothetical protein Y032_0041g385 [Ancylostoma ceylanicum]|uniref:Uncharacterized protein n=1 Tax=Ancylostoma ceylanicum TaxID=53326 RepID=A0A016UH83_9BILA|nr:hypothetical protein Y032_0041g385 [Ancylostoma ceylanicum]
MNFSKQYIWGLLVDGFKSGESATDWTRRFRAGDFSLNVSSWSDAHPDSRQQSIVAAGRFRSKANYVWKDTSLGCSLHHHRRSSAPVGEGIKVIKVCDGNLMERDLPRRAEVATELHSYGSIKNWMKPIFTADEKWCPYVNTKFGPP